MGLLTDQKQNKGLLEKPAFTLTPSVIGPTKIGQTSKSTPAFSDGGGVDPIAVGKGLLQGTARELGAVGQKFLNIATFGKAPSAIPVPTQADQLSLHKAIYGTDKPISLQSVGEEYPFVKPGSKFAPVIAVGGFLSNIGGGGETSKLLKGLTATKDATEAAGLLKKLGIAEDIAAHAGPTFAGLTDPAEVKAVFNDLKTIKTGATAEEVAKTIGLKERGFVTSVKEAYPELKKVAGQYIPRDTDALAVKAKNLIKDNIGTAENLARSGTGEEAVATASELIKHYTSEAAKTTDEAIRAALHDKAAEIANVSAENLTNLGRSVQAASILGRLTPEGMVRFAARTIQKYNETVGGSGFRKLIPELSGEQTGEILSKAKVIEGMADGREKARAIQDLMNQISDMVPTPLWKKLVTIWKAGLLTGIKTTGTNIAANLTHGITEVVKDVPAVAIDKVASLFTGKRTIGLTGSGLGGGVKEGFLKGLDYLKTGFDDRNIAGKLDYHRVNFGTSKIAKGLQKYEETIFHILGAEDQPFYYGAKARSLMDQAIAEGKNAGKKGAELKKFAEDLVANPTDDMLKYSVIDAETAVFQNPTALGRVAKTIQNIPGGEIVVPFGRTPSAAAMQIINYSPVGAAKTLISAAIDVIKQTGKFDQRLFSQQLGRSVVGTAAGYIGYKLFDDGVIALASPNTETERKQWELEGKKANSIKIGGKWRSIAVLGPAGNVILAGAYLKQGIEQTGSVTAGLVQAAAGSGKSLSEQTFLKGINQVVQALNDPERSAMTFASSLIGSTVPTIVGDVARGTDQFERRSTPGFTGNFKSRIPGVREKVTEPQVTSLGQKVNTPGFATVMLDPTRPTTDTSNDPVVSELRRLSASGHRATPTKVGDTENMGYKGLTPKQNTELLVNSGELLHRKLTALLATPTYKAADDEKRAKLISDFSSKAKMYARASMVAEVTQGLSGPELKAELSRLKKIGLMSKEVYDTYLVIR